MLKALLTITFAIVLVAAILILGSSDVLAHIGQVKI
jgi:hypothetical protein